MRPPWQKTVIPASDITFSKYVRRIDRLTHRCDLMSRQIEILCDALYSLVTVQETRTLLAHVRELRSIARRYGEEKADEEASKQ